jgi:hypothetical protein
MAGEGGMTALGAEYWMFDVFTVWGLKPFSRP